MASISKRKGAWNVIYFVTDENGKKKQKWETFHSEAEAKRRKTEIEYQQNIGKLQIPNCTTLDELLKEYVGLYGKTKWSLSAYSSNTGLIKNYISPIIGEMKLREISSRVLEKYYQLLLKTPAVKRVTDGKYDNVKRFVEKPTINKIHKLLNSVFTQAMKWDLIDRNPATFAEVPKHEAQKREIWDINTLQKVNEICKDRRLKLCINLAFACSLRLGELLGLTWDCVDITEDSIASGSASLFINKELQRVSKTSLAFLDQKDVIAVFPEVMLNNTTVRILKTPKTATSIRKVFIPKTLALELVEWKKEQDEIKEALGKEYGDFNLVIANSKGGPTEGNRLERRFKKFIEDNDLPEVVFHSLRHSSITYKLKLFHGDIKAVQGDSGHAQAKMVTDQYSHILDENRRENTQLFEDAFFGKKETTQSNNKQEVLPQQNTESADTENDDILRKLMANPEMKELVVRLLKNME